MSITRTTFANHPVPSALMPSALHVPSDCHHQRSTFYCLGYLEALHLQHGWPLPRIIHSAVLGNGKPTALQAMHLFPPHTWDWQTRIKQLILLTMSHHPSHPANKVSTTFPFPILLPWRWLSSEQLKHDNTEAVDATFCRGSHCQAILWRYLAKCTSDVSADMRWVSHWLSLQGQNHRPLDQSSHPIECYWTSCHGGWYEARSHHAGMKAHGQNQDKSSCSLAIQVLRWHQPSS